MHLERATPDIDKKSSTIDATAMGPGFYELQKLSAQSKKNGLNVADDKTETARVFAGSGEMPLPDSSHQTHNAAEIEIPRGEMLKIQSSSDGPSSNGDSMAFSEANNDVLNQDKESHQMEQEP